MAQDFESLYVGVNEKATQLLDQSAREGISAAFIGQIGTFPWAMAYSASRHELLEINDAERPRDPRRRYVNIFTANLAEGNYLITKPKVDTPDSLSWKVSADGNDPKQPSGNVHADPAKRIRLLELFAIDDLVVVPFKRVYEPRARSAKQLFELATPLDANL